LQQLSVPTVNIVDQNTTLFRRMQAAKVRPAYPAKTKTEWAGAKPAHSVVLLTGRQ
jgi:hypothetical protein